jgi:hypothetical protein
VTIYEVLLHGQGLQLDDEQGGVREGGVYVWRVVRAEDEAAAVRLASETVLNDPDFFAELRNESLERVVFEAEEIRAGSPESGGEDTGYVFYIEEDED